MSKPRKIMFVCKGDALVPASRIDLEFFRDKNIAEGQAVAVELSIPRNLMHHNLVMRMIGMVNDLLPDPFPSERAFLTVLKIKTGYVDTIIDAHSGKTYYQPMSISFEQMDEGEFRKFHRAVSRVIVRDYLPYMTQQQVEDIGRSLDEA